MIKSIQNNDTEVPFLEKKLSEQLTEILHSLPLKNSNTSKVADFQKQLTFIISLSEQKTSIEEKTLIVRILIHNYLITQDEKYMLHLSLFVNPKETNNFIISSTKDHSFENGKSGLLLLLLYTYPYLKEDWVLSSIKKLMYFFIECLFPYKEDSLVYISDESTIAPLCELYEGNSGMALIFLELGKFFNSPNLFVIAGKLISYEDKLWCSKVKNWPDFRKKITSLEEHQLHKEKYLAKDYDYFLESGDSISFKNGAIGIAFTRLKAFEYTNDKKHLKSFKKALNKINSTLNNYSHLLSGYELQLINQLNGGNDITFLSVFQEVLPLKETLIIDHVSILRSHLKFPYFNTLKIAEKLNLDIIEKFSTEYNQDAYKKTDPLKAFHFFLKEFLKKIKPLGSNQLKDILRLEYKKIKLQKSIKSIALLNIEDLVQIEQRDLFLKLNEDHLLNTQLIVNKNILLLKTKWKWIADEIELFTEQFDPTENINNDSSINYGAFKATSQYNAKRKTHILEKSLSEYQYLILDLFEYPVIVAEVLDEFSTLFEINSEAEFLSVKKMFLDIIREAIFDRFLVVA